MHVTTCDRWLEAISALADGEDPGLPEELVRSHIADCPACAACAAELGLRSSAKPSASLADAVVSSNAAVDRSPETVLLRALLAFLGFAIVAWALPGLLGAGHAGLPEHDARHLGAFEMAFGVALLVAAWRPARARTVLPVALVLTLAIVLSTAIDVADGTIALASEAQHLPELLSLPIVWLLATPVERWPLLGPRLAAAQDSSRVRDST